MWSFDRNISVSQYILRRLVRIYPLHLLCLVISLALFWMTGIPFGGYVGTFAGTFANFLLIQDWIPGHPNIRQAWNGVSWTLSCELFFYVMAPFIFPHIKSTLPRAKIGIILACYFIVVVFVCLAKLKSWNEAQDIFFYYPLPRLGEFLLGAYGAKSIKSGFRFRSKIIACALMLIPILLDGSFVPEHFRSSILATLLFDPGAFLLILATASCDADARKNWLQSPYLVQLGNQSFALYMTHAILLTVFAILVFTFFKVDFFASGILEYGLTGIFILTTVAVAAVVHQMFELPIRKRLMKLLSHARDGSMSHGTGTAAN